MKTVALVPYCPLPADTGGKVEMLTHLDVLRSMGPCKVVSAATKPVGAYWTADARRAMEHRGLSVALREESCPRRTARQLAGVAYAAFCKALRWEKAFGHSNPYHRYAFPPAWWYEQTCAADLAVMFYSFWVRLPTACPKVVVLLDLWSDYFWEGHRRETEELKKADLVVVISRDEFRTLRDRGIQRLLWMPPRVPAEDMSDSDAVGLLGSNGSVNREGLAWLTRGLDGSFPIRVYGALAEAVQGRGFVRCGRYAETMQPYRECGIILMPTAEGMGVQVKTIEALAAGRAIVARRGAIRGIPRDSEAWMEVETAGDMIRCARELRNSVAARMALSRKAREYYDRHLQAERLFAELAGAYRELVYKTQASRTSVVSQK